jgi:hypothetical protein
LQQRSQLAASQFSLSAYTIPLSASLFFSNTSKSNHLKQEMENNELQTSFKPGNQAATPPIKTERGFILKQEAPFICRQVQGA